MSNVKTENKSQEQKNVVENPSTLVSDYLAKCQKLGITVSTNAVGNNGYQNGQTFTVSGEMKVIESEINGNKTCFIAVPTEEGTNLSLRQLLGLSSMNGYHTDGEYESEHREGTKIITTIVTPSVVDGFDFANVFQPVNRVPIEYANMIANQETANPFTKGTKITYLGTVARPIIARRDSPVTSFEKYKKGDKRVITARLWQVETV